MSFSTPSACAWRRFADGAPELPAAAALAPATSPLVGMEGRYAKPRRGELVDEPLMQMVWAFSLPGQWVAIDPTVDYDPNTGELTLA